MIREYFILKDKREKFSNLMVTMNLKGFYLIDDKKIENGHILFLKIPPDKSYSDLEKAKEKLENYFKGIIELSKDKFTNYISMKVITKDIGSFKFEPVKSCYNKLFVGKTFDNKPYFLDLNKPPDDNSSIL